MGGAGFVLQSYNRGIERKIASDAVTIMREDGDIGFTNEVRGSIGTSWTFAARG